MDLPEANSATSTTFTNQEIKPRIGSFLMFRFVVTFFVALLIGAVATAIFYSFELSPWLGLLGFLLVAGVGVISGLATFRKERYQIQATRLVCHRGGLISDEETEFEIRNITHVKIKLPWLRYKFRKVGNVIVETAGTSVPLVFRCVHDPESIYSEIRERMKANGYDLTQRELLHEEKPALITVVLESLAMFVITSLGCVFAISGMLSDAEIAPEKPMLIAIFGTVILGSLVFIILRFLDIIRRTYRVYNDVVVYEEGFLTRQNAFIPYENISDSDTKRTLLDQILGLYDVQISCQGSSSEIKFRRLKNGVKLSQSIDQIVSFASNKVRPPKLPGQEGQTQLAAKRPRRIEPKTISNLGLLEREYRISPSRMLVPLILLLPLIPIWIDALIKLTSTRFFIRQNSIRYSYSFLRVDEREFTCDKITGVEIKRNLWDKWFGTMTVKFQSIGASKPIEFMHVPYDPLEVEMLLCQVGIPKASANPYAVCPKFELMTWLSSKLWAVIAFLMVTAGVASAAVFTQEPYVWFLMVPVAFVAIYALIYAMLYYPRQRLSFHDHHVQAEQGIISKRFFHVRYKNIKRVTATRYPGGEKGALQIFIAGEEELMPQAKQQASSLSRMKKQSSFTTHMLSDAYESGRLLDDILCGKVDATSEAKPAEPAGIILESSRSVGHAVLKLIIVSVLLFPLILLLPFTILATIITVKCWSYRVDDFRVVWKHGVFFKKITSVLFDRVDSLQKSQGPLNKIFKNGTVSIMSAGSSKADLVIIGSPDYLKIYDAIRTNTESDE
ncbi:MAG: PH domain-containing protein [Verrucomicrobiota bacterium]